MIDADDWRLVFMPEDVVTAASGMCMAMRDRWFSVHPARGLIFWQDEKRRKGQIKGASPQCNGAESIARDLAEKMYPWAEARFYPLVLMPIDHRDYC